VQRPQTSERHSRTGVWSIDLRFCANSATWRCRRLQKITNDYYWLVSSKRSMNLEIWTGVL